MARKKGSGRPVTVTTEENSEKVEEMICSQEEPGTHTSPREIAKQLDISHCSVRRMVKRRNISGFKRLKTPGMNDGTRGRRLERASNLVRKFEQNPRMVERAVFQDESPFTLEVPVNSQNNRVYFKGDKSDVPEENLCHQGNRQSKKVMVSAGLTWHGATRPFFVNDKGIKVNAVNYRRHLKNQLFPAIEKVYKWKDWIFVQDGAPSHRSNLVQTFLDETLNRRYIKAAEWPPSSPDSNPLDYYFWSVLKTKVYEGRMNKPFVNEDALKRRIKSVWNECASNISDIRKAIKQ